MQAGLLRRRLSFREIFVAGAGILLCFVSLSDLRQGESRLTAERMAA